MSLSLIAGTAVNVFIFLFDNQGIIRETLFTKLFRAVRTVVKESMIGKRNNAGVSEVKPE